MTESWQDDIVQFAGIVQEFSLLELENYLTREKSLDDAALHVMETTLYRLVKSGKLQRLRRGVYAKTAKNSWQVVLTHQEREIAERIHRELPLVNVCVYNGETFAPLQHHLAFNQVSYIEVDRDSVEVVFHKIQDMGLEVYRKPDEQMVNDYIDLKKKIVIVKPLVTQAPLMTQDGLRVPSIEKLLVDIRKDKDFFYMHGAEASYMIEAARTLYVVDEQKLKRYANRRTVVI